MKALVCIQHYNSRGGGIIPIGKRLLKDSLIAAIAAEKFKIRDPGIEAEKKVESRIGRRPAKGRDKEGWFRWMRDREGLKAERKQMERAEMKRLAKAINS